MEKKGVSMFPFVVIFVLIVGAMILIFFLGFSGDILSKEDKVSRLLTVNLIDKQLAALSGASDSSSELTLPLDSVINISCFSMEGSRIQDIGSEKSKEEVFKRDTEKLVLAPLTLRKDVTFWGLDWNYPFKIDKFYFLIDEDIHFYFHQAPLPPRLTRFKEGFSNKIVTLDVGLSAPFDKKGTRIIVPKGLHGSYSSYTKATVLEVDFDSNTTNYYKNNIHLGEVIFWGEAMAYASLFAKTPEEYNCFKDIAYERLKRVVTVYDEKAIKLPRISSITTSCADPATEYNINFHNMLINFKSDPMAHIDQLVSQNDELEKKGCPPVIYKQ